MIQLAIANAFWDFLHKSSYFISVHVIWVFFFFERAMKSIISQYNSLYSFILAKT